MTEIVGAVSAFTFEATEGRTSAIVPGYNPRIIQVSNWREDDGKQYFDAWFAYKYNYAPFREGGDDFEFEATRVEFRASEFISETPAVEVSSTLFVLDRGQQEPIVVEYREVGVSTYISGKPETPGGNRDVREIPVNSFAGVSPAA